MDIFNKFNTILSRDLKTNRDLTRIQHGIQPKNVIQDEPETVPYSMIDENDMESAIKNHKIGIRGLYHSLNRIEFNLEILDQFKSAKIQKELKILRYKKQQLESKLNDYYEKLTEWEKKFYRKKYGYLIERENEADVIRAIRLIEGEFRQKLNAKELSMRDFNRWFDERMYETKEEEQQQLREARKQEEAKKTWQRNLKTYNRLDSEIEQLRTEIYGILEGQQIKVNFNVEFDIQDVSKVYDDFFSKISGKTDRQRAVIKDFRLNFGDDSEIEEHKIIFSRAPVDVGNIFEEMNKAHLIFLNDSSPEAIQMGSLVVIACPANEGENTGKKVSIKDQTGQILLFPYQSLEDLEKLESFNPNTSNFILVCSKIRTGIFRNNAVVSKLQDYIDRVFNSEKATEGEVFYAAVSKNKNGLLKSSVISKYIYGQSWQDNLYN